MYKINFRLFACAFMILAFNANVLALKPSKVYLAVPDTMHLPYEKNIVTTTDGLQLNSWTFLPNKNAGNKITIVMSCADAGNMSWWLSYAAVLSQVGYTVVMFDYRGFGESADFAIDSRMLYYNEFVKDLEAVVTFAKQKYHGNKTGVWCFSMGSIITTLATQSIKPDFIVGDSYVTSPVRIKEFYAPQNVKIDLPADVNTYEYTLAQISIPMLVFSGEDDKVTTPESIKLLQKNKPALKIISYKGGHMAGFATLTDPHKYLGSGYVAAINNFLKAD